MSDASSLSGRRIAAMAALAAILHGAFDVATYRFILARPPYLRLEDAPEAFQMLPPLAVSVAVCIISGLIAAIAVLALPPWRRGTVALGATVAGFWIFSAVLLRAVWMSTGWGVTLAALLFGLPRALAIGWALARLAAPPPLSISTDAKA